MEKMIFQLCEKIYKYGQKCLYEVYIYKVQYCRFILCIYCYSTIKRGYFRKMLQLKNVLKTYVTGGVSVNALRGV